MNFNNLSGSTENSRDFSNKTNNLFEDNNKYNPPNDNQGNFNSTKK